MIPQLYSTSKISTHYDTGEKPVLVECNDMHSYICKYPRYSGNAGKLVCELLGALLAKAWKLNTPDVAFVGVRQHHVPADMSGSLFSRILLGSRKCENVIDITSGTIPNISPSVQLTKQLLKIALFDMWIANEDRNANNANLMYDLVNDSLVAIDFGCSFNTSTLEYPLSQLTETDSIINSDLFRQIAKNMSDEQVKEMANELVEHDYPAALSASKEVIESGIENIVPKEWSFHKDVLRMKTNELLTREWTSNVKTNYEEILNSVLNNG